MDKRELQRRMRAFALRVIRMTDTLPRRMSGDVLGRQVLRSATSVAANYRAACRAKSRADFVSKMGTVEEEADETAFWLDLIGAAELVPAAKLSALQQEADEPTAIAVASIKTARARPDLGKPGGRNPQSPLRNPK